MSTNRHCWRLPEMSAMFVCVFEQRACWIANFNAGQSQVTDQEVRL